MSSQVQFETPENVLLSYQVAGLGTRFVAWFVDSILIWVFSFLSLIALFAAGAASELIFRQVVDPMESADPAKRAEVMLYFLGIFLLIFGLGSFVYYGLFELLMRGQTPGKRWLGIRVVKADGFSLDPGSIVVRNIFRVVDQIPLLWIVPVVNAKSQRFGDMVAGTLVVLDRPEVFSNAREAFATRPPVEGQFRFSATALQHLRPVDVEAVERLLERWNQLAPNTRSQLVEQIVAPLATRLAMDVPADEASRLQFLEDLLAAEYRRQYRKLN